MSGCARKTQPEDASKHEHSEITRTSSLCRMDASLALDGHHSDAVQHGHDLPHSVIPDVAVGQVDGCARRERGCPNANMTRK